MEVIMNTRSSRHPAIWIALVIVFAMACNAITPLFTPLQATPTAEILHFENELVAFDYKYEKGMEVFEAGNAPFQCNPPFELGGELVVGLGIYKYSGLDIYNRSIRIFRQPMPFDSNLETIMQEAYQKAGECNRSCDSGWVVSLPVDLSCLCGRAGLRNARCLDSERW
jgi:hypothetical protein